MRHYNTLHNIITMVLRECISNIKLPQMMSQEQKSDETLSTVTDTADSTVTASFKEGKNYISSVVFCNTNI